MVVEVVVGICEETAQPERSNWSQRCDPWFPGLEILPKITLSCLLPCGGTSESLVHAVGPWQSKSCQGWRGLGNLPPAAVPCPPGHHGLVFPAHGFQPALGQVRCSEEVPVPSALLPPPAVPTVFWGSLMGQAQSHPPYVGFGYLTLPTPISLGVISNNSHILPPKWSMNNLEKLLRAII